MNEHLADGLLAAFESVLARLRPSAEDLLDWLRRAAVPPDGVELRASDGTMYTGIAGFDRNKIVIMLAVKTGQSVTAAASSIALGPAPSPAYRPPPQRRLFGPDEDDDPGDGWPPDDPFLRRR